MQTLFSGLPWFNLIVGGALIGAGAAVLMLCNGRVAGISGIYGRLLGGDTGAGGWQAAFLIGLLIPAWAGGRIVTAHVASVGLMLAAGLLVGIGTRIGAGCTSGHGVCGMANLSPRSLAATLVFMGVAMLVVFLARHAGVAG